jgi:alpha-D-ribose 1-methylphosphonate 5-triphosphate synthase subunit PhnG
MDPTLVVAAAALILALAGPVLVALSRLSWSQVELRLATAERRLEAQAALIAAAETRLAVVTSEHGGTARALARIEATLSQLTSKLLGRASVHEREGDDP